MPILVDFAEYDAAPDNATLTRLRRRAEGGGAHWLFVGRVAPHKSQHDIIAAFAAYRRLFDPRARLSIVGERRLLLYARALERLAAELGVADAVDFTDNVRFPQLLAHYRAADVFVSLSEHEGFCVPLVEAMHFGVPTVAFASTAVPETVGDATLLLPDKDPLTVAVAAHRVLSDDVLRKASIEAGHRRVEHFSLANNRRRLLEALEPRIAAGDGDAACRTLGGKGRIAFVPPRYGDDVVGGAETVLRQAAERLAVRGWEVEILTTCARDHYTWANVYPAGTSHDGDLTVHRFPVVHPENDAQWQGLDRRIGLGSALSTAEQHAWINSRFRVPDLVHHLVANAHGYRAIIFSPYLFWTTVAGATVAPERTIVIPCLHDEACAYLPVFGPVLSGSAQVWFMSEPEHRLAHRIGPVTPDHPVTGEGILVPDRYDPEGFRARHG